MCAASPGPRIRGAQPRGTRTTGTRTAGVPTAGARTPGTATPGTATPGLRTLGAEEQRALMMTTSIPAPAKRLILAVSAAGALVVAAQVPFTVAWSLRDALSWAVLALLITVLEQFPIHVRFRTETLNMSMTDAVWTAGLLLVQPSVLLLAVAAGAAAGQILRRRQLYKATFNVGQYLFAVGAG